MSYSQLTNSWKLWYNSPNNSDWSINSYGEIMEINNVETCKTICTQFINENLLTSCMIFIMKNNIKPVWKMIIINPMVAFHLNYKIKLYIHRGKH